MERWNSLCVPGGTAFENKWAVGKDRAKTVDFKSPLEEWNYNRGLWGEEVKWRVLIAAASININQPLSTFHTSTLAARGHRVHLPWPLTAISPSNDAFFLGHMQIETGAQCFTKKVISPSKPSPTLFQWG